MNDGRHLLAGEFGMAARLSPKALRLYAEQGLLPPSAVDPVTGYRLYSPDQLPRARLIGKLRRLGLPLARIGVLADLPTPARDLELRAWLHAQREQLEDRAAEIESMWSPSDDPALTGAITVREMPARKVLCRSRQIDSHALGGFTSAAERDIRAHLRAGGLADDGVKLVFFQDLVTPATEATVEVAIAYEGSTEPTGDLHIRLVPGHTAVILPVPTKYEEIPLILQAYDAVEAWIDAHPGHIITGHPYEIYPGTAARFDVAYPVS